MKTLTAAAALTATTLVAQAADAQVLYTLESPNPYYYGAFGISISGAGDVNGDAHGDVVVGAFYESINGMRPGRAYVFGGQGGTLLHTLESPNPEHLGYFGYSVSRCGDVNNDGYDDVIVGAYREDGGATDAGSAHIFAGDGGGLLQTLLPPRPQTNGYFGHSVSVVGDVDNDGCSDVVVGAPDEDGGALEAGRAYLFSGDDGGLLCALQSPNPEPAGRFGWSVSGARDVNNDGYDDVVVGAWHESGGGY